ncbi:MAG: D-alanyl-D-alanine carboxypeptidase/D-alanyl-D-alanine-endopeptidase [Phycisphaerales bacterium]|nr:D-alanyl-D-alanine carboxypeptidase/D-alanyl-D-alanine-endopeptidase [Phycisphaerales bacterium]
MLPTHLARLGAALTCSATLAAPSLDRTIDALAARSGLTPGTWGASVVACDGRVLAGVDADTPRIPASNMKLLSSGTAIAILGPDWRFRTRLLKQGDDVIIVGDGDPALADPDLLADMTDELGRPMTADGILDIWADAIEATGVRSIDRLVVDDRVFDQAFIHPSWPREQLSRHYCAGSAGLNFHRNMLHLRPAPGPSGPRLDDVRPAVPFLPIDNRLKSHGSKTEVSVHRAPGTDAIAVSGTVAQPLVVPVDVTVQDMPLLTGRMLADRLSRRGIEVNEITRPTEDERFDSGTGASAIGPDIVTPMTTVLRQCNVESRNIYADALLKRAAHEATGRPGAWRDGSALVRREVRARTGIERVEVADGSGMSRQNKVSPSVLAAWLASFKRGTPEGDALLDSLSTIDRGTVKRRFGSLDLHGCTLEAKTGYISGVSTLSGVISAPDGRCAAFSVLCNNLKNTKAARAMQKDLVEATARWLTSGP